MKSRSTLLFILITLAVGCSNSNSDQASNINLDSPGETVENNEYQNVLETLRLKDSLLFELGFNHCDTAQLKLLVSNDFEFYHDQSGITNSKESFIQSISGLCDLDYRPSRELAKGSLELHLLRENGKIYGAIQNGKHKFYGEESDRPKYLTSTADFTHLWIIEEGDWKLKRVLSYNHKTPN